VNDVTVVDAAGRITRGDAVDAFRKTAGKAVQAGSEKLLLNLKEVEFIDSAGIGVLVAAVTQTKCSKCGEIYSTLVHDKCPKCDASVDNSEMEVNAVDGIWTPPWGKCKLLHPNKKLEDLLRVTKLHSAFRIYHDETIALASF
jgi:anti-sigma B factor antagonist